MVKLFVILFATIARAEAFSVTPPALGPTPIQVNVNQGQSQQQDQQQAPTQAEVDAAVQERKAAINEMANKIAWEQAAARGKALSWLYVGGEAAEHFFNFGVYLGTTFDTQALSYQMGQPLDNVRPAAHYLYGVELAVNPLATIFTPYVRFGGDSAVSSLLSDGGLRPDSIDTSVGLRLAFLGLLGVYLAYDLDFGAWNTTRVTQTKDPMHPYLVERRTDWIPNHGFAVGVFLRIKHIQVSGGCTIGTLGVETEDGNIFNSFSPRCGTEMTGYLF